MPTTTVDVQELPSRLMEVISLAQTGAEVIVTEGNIPRARLIPLSPGEARVAGLHAGAIMTTGDFDAPLAEDFWLGTPWSPLQDAISSVVPVHPGWDCF